MTAKRVEYIGPLRPGVVIRDANSRPVTAGFGETVEVDGDTAKGLLSQPDNWREPKPGPKPGAKPGSTPASEEGGS